MFWILATTSKLQIDLRDFDRALAGEDWPQRLMESPLLWGALFALAGAMIFLFVMWLRRRRDVAQHRPTWRRLAGALQLSRAQRTLVEELAKTVGLHNPAPLVISRGFFDHAARQMHPLRQPAPIRQLRERIFSE